MNLSMTGELAAAYHSGAQRARVVTESWGESNLYCPNCSSPKLTWLEPGHPASDYSCPHCGFWYQLKSQKSRIGDSITDGAYAAMMNAIRHDELPSFYFMQYDLMTWSVRNLLLVPHFAFPPSAIIKRKPLAATARRAGWIGCNFNLSRIPTEARIPVLNGVRSLGKKEFTNTDAYTLARRLEKLHPDNRHVKDKIRQQLQVLRDAKLLLHVGSGVWRLP